MPFWRHRDRERFIGGYDPEHEMPNPDRSPRERYESDAYRHNSSDSRFGYRWNPDRFEERFAGRRDELPRDRDWNRDARDRFYEDRFAQTRMARDGRSDYGGMNAPRSYERGSQYDRGWDYDRNRGRDMGSFNDRDTMSDRDSGRYSRDREYDGRYGWDYGSERPYGSSDRGYGRDFDRDYDRSRNLGGRSMPDWDREERMSRDRDYGWEDVGDIPYDRNRGRRY